MCFKCVQVVQTWGVQVYFEPKLSLYLWISSSSLTCCQSGLSTGMLKKLACFEKFFRTVISLNSALGDQLRKKHWTIEILQNFKIMDKKMTFVSEKSNLLYK